MRAKIGQSLISTIAITEKPYDIRDSELKGFILRVRPSGLLTYMADFRTKDGKRSRMILGRPNVLNPIEARKQAKAILGEVAKGRDPRSETKKLRVPTMKNFIEEKYASWFSAHRKAGIENQKALLSPVFKDLLELRLDQINSWAVERWRHGRLKQNVKPVTINRDLARLRSLLSKAVDWNVITSHPFGDRVRPCKVDCNSRTRFLNDEEELRLRLALDTREDKKRDRRLRGNLLRAKRQHPSLPTLSDTFVDHLKPMVLISLNTGLRQGELFNLRWRDIDFDRRSVTVTQESAKSGKSRHIPLNCEAHDALTDWRAQTFSNEYVFLSPTNKRFDNVKRAWKGLLHKAKIENFRWHDLRHQFASRLVIEGVDLNIVRELLGHSGNTGLKMTLRYAHLTPQIKMDAVNRIIRKIS